MLVCREPPWYARMRTRLVPRGVSRQAAIVRDDHAHVVRDPLGQDEPHVLIDLAAAIELEEWDLQIFGKDVGCDTREDPADVDIKDGLPKVAADLEKLAADMDVEREVKHPQISD